MSDQRFTIHRRAWLAYNVITPKERAAVDAAVERLADLPEEQWAEAGAARLETAEPLYVVNVDRSLRALVRATPGGRPELDDLVRQERLDRYFKDVTYLGQPK
jgi:hypothetical protein